MIWALILAACPHEERGHGLVAVKSAAAIPDQVETPGLNPLPGWRSGFSATSEMKSQPSEVWSFTLDGPITEPIIGESGQFFATADGRVYAFSTAGQRQWELKLAATGSPALALDSVVVAGYEGRVRWLDRATGRDKTVTTEGGTTMGSVVPIDGGYAWISEDGVISTSAGWEVKTALRPSARPAADGSTLYVVGGDGRLIAAGAKGILWESSIPGTPVDGPVLDAENVYVAFAASGKEPGGVVAIRRNEGAGTVAWTFRSEFQPLACPAVGDAVYLPDKDGTLYALSLDAGTVLWRNEAYGAFTTQPLIVGKSLYVGNADGNVYRIDTFDGGTAWTADLGAPVTGQPAIVGNVLAVGLANGRIVGLRP